jgi:hypothetical protein
MTVHRCIDRFIIAIAIAVYVFGVGCYRRSFDNDETAVAFKVISCLGEGRGCAYIERFVDSKNVACRYAKDSPGGRSPELVDLNTGATMSGRDVGKAYYQKSADFLLDSAEEATNCSVIIETSSAYSFTICNGRLSTFHRLGDSVPNTIGASADP